jgi:hypothetical protein
MTIFARLLDRWRGLLTRDFYLARAGLAAHFEKEWGDLLLTSQTINFNFAPFEPKFLSLGDSLLVSKSILEIAEKSSWQPASVLEIGPGLGRTFYEVLKESSSIKKAQLVEPSEYLATGLKELFKGDSLCSFPLIFGNEYLSEVEVNPGSIRDPFKKIDLEIINKPFEKVLQDLVSADLVLCLNVVDQCKHPKALLDLVKAKTNVNGFLIVSCTFLWQKKYPWSKGAPFKNLRSQFGGNWEVVREDNLPFSIRVNERFWYTFLSQVLYLRRLD